MKNAVFWDDTPCGSCKNRRFGETITSIIKVTRTGELGTMLTVTSNRLARATRRNIPEDAIPQSVLPFPSSIDLFQFRITLKPRVLETLGKAPRTVYETIPRVLGTQDRNTTSIQTPVFLAGSKPMISVMSE
jgi:hypothetical protein